MFVFPHRWRLECGGTVTNAGKGHVESYEAMPWLLAYLSRHGLSHAQLGYEPPAVLPLLDGAKIVTGAPDPFGDELIAQLPAAAWDVFTREGQQAIRPCSTLKGVVLIDGSETRSLLRSTCRRN